MKLEELQKLCDEATPGPWQNAIGWQLKSGELTICELHHHWQPNRELIAAARTALPKLIALAKAIKRVAPLHRPKADIEQGTLLGKEWIAMTSALAALEQPSGAAIAPVSANQAEMAKRFGDDLE